MFKQIPLIAKGTCIFGLFCLSWFIFRMGSLPPGEFSSILHLFGSACCSHPFTPFVAWVPSLICFGGGSLAFQYYWEKSECFSDWKPWQKTFWASLLLCSIFILGNFQGSQFIYFQF